MNKEKVVLYGAASALDKIYHALKTCYTILAITDSNIMKKEKIENMGERYITPDEIISCDYDLIIITSSYWTTITALLMSRYNIERTKIRQWEEVYFEKRLSLGVLNPDKTFYVLRNALCLSGLFAYVSAVVQSLESLEGNNFEFFVDFQNYHNAYLEESKIGKENSWEYFFEQPCGKTANEVYKSKDVILGTGSHLLPSMNQPPNDISISYLDEQRLKSYAADLKQKELYRKYIVLNKAMQKVVTDEYNRLFVPILRAGKKICGVFYRGTDYTKLKVYAHPIQPSIEQVIENTRQLMDEWGFDYIYFDSEDGIAFKEFCNAFPDNVIFSERARVENYPNKVVNYKFERENDLFLKGMEYVRAVFLMAKCNFFISGYFGGSNSVRLITEGFEDEHLFFEGYYGFHDDSFYMTPNGSPIFVNKNNQNNHNY